MGQPVILVANLVLGDTLLVQSVNGKGEMQPNREITREELAVVMMRYAKSCGIAGADAEPSEEGITDWADVSSFAMSSIKWALANGVISGVDNLDGTRSLCPHDSASRAQMAKIILNVEAMRARRSWRASGEGLRRLARPATRWPAGWWGRGRPRLAGNQSARLVAQ